MNQYVKQYQKTQVETASNEKILIMLYDGAIQFLNQAKVALGNKNYQESNNSLIGAQNILNEFINTIDPTPNPELANNLISLYRYFLDRLVQANIKHQVEPIDEVLVFLKDLKATWEQAINLAQEERANISASAAKSQGVDYYDDDEDEEDEEDDDE